MPVCGVQTACGEPLQQSLAQSPEHFAMALYNPYTECEAVLEPSLGLSSYGQLINLEFVGVDDPRARAQLYHFCPDTSWDMTFGYIF